MVFSKSVEVRGLLLQVNQTRKNLEDNERLARLCLEDQRHAMKETQTMPDHVSACFWTNEDEQ